MTNSNPVANGLNPDDKDGRIQFNLALDIPDNDQMLTNGSGQTLGQHVRNDTGGAPISLFGDLKRHDMGSRLAEAIADNGVDNSVFLTENLWGVGSTAPYLHDGRATTITEAILFHGGEAQTSRDAFASVEPENGPSRLCSMSMLRICFGRIRAILGRCKVGRLRSKGSPPRNNCFLLPVVSVLVLHRRG